MLPPMDMTSDLIQKIERFCALTGTTVTAYGRDVMGDAKFVRELRNGGRSPTVRTIEKNLNYMAKAIEKHKKSLDEVGL